MFTEEELFDYIQELEGGADTEVEQDTENPDWDQEF